MAVPDEIDRIDVAGGTLPGWSALITLLGATRLYSGGHLTVLDLSEGAIAKDLIELARRGGDDPLVWVLPADLPRLDLGADAGARGVRRRARPRGERQRGAPHGTRDLGVRQRDPGAGAGGARRERARSARSPPRCGRWPRSATRATTCGSG